MKQKWNNLPTKNQTLILIFISFTIFFNILKYTRIIFNVIKYTKFW